MEHEIGTTCMLRFDFVRQNLIQIRKYTFPTSELRVSLLERGVLKRNGSPGSFEMMALINPFITDAD